VPLFFKSQFSTGSRKKEPTWSELREMVLTSDRVEGVISFHLSYCARFHDLVVSCDAARCESAKSGRFWAMPMIEIEDCAHSRSDGSSEATAAETRKSSSPPDGAALTQVLRSTTHRDWHERSCFRRGARCAQNHSSNL